MVQQILDLVSDFETHQKVFLKIFLILVDAIFNFTFGWDHIKKDGVDYVAIKDEKLTYSTGRSYYKLDNLFNGDKVLGKLELNISCSKLNERNCRRSNEYIFGRNVEGGSN